MLRNRLKYTVFCCSVLVLCFWTFTAFSQSAKPVVLIDPAHGGEVAGTVEHVAEQVEADADVADAGRREGACDVRRLRHWRAPSDCATARMSPKMPAAVTCGPAPGPCTTSGLSA